MSDITKTKSWYVLRTAGGKEKKAKEMLEKEIVNHNLQKYITQVFVQIEKYVVEKNGKKLTKERSHLPGYLFVEAILTGEVIHIVRNTQHISGFLGGKDPVPMRQEEVNKMLGISDELAESSTNIVNRFIVGESVKVKDGPFSNFSGKIEKISADGKKLDVMISIFGRQTPIELNHTQVERE
jgi:transcriptional antiterminator NusG